MLRSSKEILFTQVECTNCFFTVGGGGGPPGAGQKHNLEDMMKSMGGLRGNILHF